MFFINKTTVKNQKLKLFLVIVIFFLLVIILSVFIGYRLLSDKKDGVVLSINSKANVSISKVYQTSTRNGIKEWSLKAKSADYIEPKKQAKLKDISVTFFLKDNEKVYLTADYGVLKTDSNDMEVTGNVVVQNEKYILKTEKLNYENTKRVIFSKVPVKIVGDSINLAADSMRLDLNTNRAFFEGRVRGIFSETITM